MVAEIMSKVKKLFYQNNRHFASVAKQFDHLAYLFDDIRLNPFGRLIKQQQFGTRDQRSGDSKLLLLPTRQIAAAAPKKFLEDREELKNFIGYRPFGFRQTSKASFKVLSNCQKREYFAPLRHISDSFLSQRICRSGTNDFAIEGVITATTTMCSGDRLE